jgi:hypothetical protein
MMKKHQFCKAVAVVLICMLALCVDAIAMDDRFLTHVQIQPAVMDMSDSPGAQVSWQQSLDGEVQAVICDLDGNIVRILVDKESRPAGTHTVSWDGNDLNGRPCPIGAYLPIIKIKTRRGRSNVHNPTASDWGEELVLEPPVFDPGRQSIGFQLPKPALCLLRIGKVKGGPCYGTLLNWVPRPAGDNQVAWDGWDAQHVVNVGAREDLTFRLITITLPETSIMILSSPADDHPSDTDYQHFPLHPPHGQNVFIHATHRRNICHDFTISARVERQGLKFWGTPAVKDEIDINVSLDNNPNYDRLKKEHFEIYLFADDQFIKEEKRESIPSTITLKTRELSNGPHIVTVGLRTLEDHLGTYTLKINVDN